MFASASISKVHSKSWLSFCILIIKINAPFLRRPILFKFSCTKWKFKKLRLKLIFYEKQVHWSENSISTFVIIRLWISSAFCLFIFNTRNETIQIKDKEWFSYWVFIGRVKKIILSFSTCWYNIAMVLKAPAFLATISILY